MTKRPPLQPDRRPCSLAVRLSPHGLLRRYALLSGMGLSVIAGGTFPIAAQAAPFGSAAWLSQMNAARAGGTAGTGAAGSSSAVSSGSAAVGGVTTAQQAERQAQHSMNDLLNALSAIRAAQLAQSVAAQAAVKGPNNLGKDPNHPGQMLPDVPDGIGVGGLQIATGADGTPVIQGAGAPTANAGNTVVTVDQNAPKAILTWQTFNVGKNTTLVFDQSAGTQKDGSNSWVALNRVLDPTAHPAQILGTIKAQGDVYIIDGSGIIFGGSSQVNTHSLLASSMQLFSTDTAASNSQFLGGGLAANLGFTPVRILVGGATPSQDGKSVVTTGDITIQQGAAISTGETGYSLIAAPNVYNYGSITATDGQAILAAGTEVSLSSGGNSSQLSPTLTGALRINNPNGGSIDLTPEGHLLNDGLIQSQRGNITLVGYQIDQEDVLAATTSVSRPGSITISAHDENAIDGSGPGRGGPLTFGAQSVTAILPEEDGATTASSTAASAAFQPGSATFSGDSITFLGGKGGGALVEAPGAALTISADLVGSAASQAADDRGKHVQGRVYMADGNIIDVSGLADVELPVADTLVTIGPLTENDLADSPLQRGGFLFTQTVTVDSTVSGTTAGGQSWIGSPIIDASAYVQNVPRKIDQLLVNGGSVNLSGSEVITAKYSNIDLDGGFINYLAGMVGATTNLLGADGHVYNIANADPSIAYVGFAGQYVVSNPRFNSTQTYTDPVLSGGVAHYDPGFIQGGNAGTLNIAVGVSSASGNAGTAILDGGLSAHAYAGRNQVAFGSAPAGGTFSIGKTSAALSPSYVVTNHGVDLNQLAQGASGFTYNTPISSDGSDPTVGTTNLSYWSPLNGNTISTAGFSHVAITAYQGQIVEDHGATLAVQPAGQGASGSSISLNAAEVTVDGNLTARAGNISIVTNGLTSGPTFKLNSIGDAQAPGNITIGADATLDASGEWVNDSGLGAAQFSGSQFINGGSISLMAAQSSSIAASGVGHQTVAIDTTGSVTVNGTLDVSSGGYVQSNGKLLMQNGVPVGQGGSITLETYALGSGGYFNGLGGLVLPATQPVGGQVQLAGATLRSAGFSGGGTLTIQAPGFQIVPAGTVVSINGVPQTVNGPVTDPVSGTLYLPSGYFQQGFGGYVLNAEYDATIAAGTAAKNQVILSQQNLIPDYPALLHAPTGTRLVGSGLTTAGRLPDYLRQPAASLTLTAGDYYNWKGAGSLPLYPKVTGTVLLESNAEIDADAGASITLGSANQVAVLGGIVAHGGHILLSGADATSIESTGIQLPNTIPGQSVVLGQNAVLDVSGTALTNPYATPVVIDGQRVMPQTGKVLAGGSVSIDSENILAMPGAVIDVSGASRDGVNGFDLLQASGGYARQDAWSDAGQITLAAASNLYFGGTINAKAGAAADGSASGQGGSLTLLALNGTGNSSATGITSLVPDGTASAVILRGGNPLPWSGSFKVGATPGFPGSMTAGTLDFWTGSLGDSGISSLAIRAQSTVNPAGPVPGPLTIGFAGNVNISLAQSFSADASNFIALAAGAYTVPALADAARQSNDVGGSIIDIAAPYVSLSGYDYTQNGNLTPPQPILGNATLNIGSAAHNTVQFIDLGGAFALENFHDAHFYSNGAIRFVTPENYDFNGAGITPQRGAMYTAGNLTFTASELYPASGNIFLIDAVGPTDPVSQMPLATTVTINGNGQQAGVPLSAGGSLLIDATGIVQSGTIWAPSGNIVLGVGNPNDSATNALFNPISSGAAQADNPMPLVATQNVWLGSNSITSVSLHNSVVPYGVTVDGKQWQYNASATGNTTQADLTAPPSKLIEVNGAKVSLDGGAVVDLSGGGELQAAEWVPGVGGTRNVLAQYSTSYANNAQGSTVPLYTDRRPVYAVIPGYTTVAPYDPVFSQTLQPGGSGSLAAGQAAPGSLVGQAVYLSGAPGLAAGIYTLLPAQYATLPGAFRVVQNSGTLDSLPAGNAVLPDGTAIVAGYFVNLLDGSRQARSTSFQVQSASTWGQYSQYTKTTADSFFSKLAAQAGTVTPQLPMDAGQLILGASADLKLGDSSPASGAPVTPPTLLTSAVNGGAAALIDIASQDIQILGSNEAPIAGYLELNAGELDKLGAGSLLIGGTRRQTGSGVTITALADSVVVSTDANTPLQAPEILLVTKTDPTKADPGSANGLRVDSGSVVTATGSFPAGADEPITIGQLAQAAVLSGDGSIIVPAVNAVSGDGALLRVSNGAPVSLNRVNLPAQGAALGLLTVQAGARISADDPHSGSLLLDSTGATAADPGAVLSANTIAADAGSIVFAPGAGVPASGSLVLGQNTLTQFANAQQIVLRSYNNIDFEGAVNVNIGKGSLTLSAGGFTTGQYGTAPGEVDLSAPSGTLTLGNALNAPKLVSASSSQGPVLNLSASEIDFGTSAGTGSVGFAGFSSLTATAKAPQGGAANGPGAGIVGQGNGTFDFGAMPVALSAPVILAGGDSAITLTTTGAITTSSPADGGAVLAAASSALGGALTLKGGSISDGGLISAPAGNITLDATAGNLVVSGTVSVAGVPKQFFDITEYAPGGNILLAADSGNLSLQSGATLDFSANAGGGNAGSLSVSAPSGSVLLQGKLVGGAAKGQGGSFSLDSSSGLAASGAGSLDALADALGSGGVNHAISVVTQSGNLQLSSGHSLTAQIVALTANASSAQADPSNGNVVIGGTIDAGGAAGGEIDLYGRSGVELQGTSELSAASTGTAQRGGKINLGTSAVYDNNSSVNGQYGYENFGAADSGSILIDAGASINLAAGPVDPQNPNGKPADGTLNIRAPLLANGDINLVIDPAVVITGANGTPGAVNVEAYAVWSTADTGSSGPKHFDGIIDPAGWYQKATSGSAAGLNMVLGTWTDQDGNVVSAATASADPSKYYFTPTQPNADHAGFYQTTLAGFVQNPGFAGANFSRLAGSANRNLKVRPGIELDNPVSANINNGDITIATNWNLGACSPCGGAGAQYSYRYSYQGQQLAPVLTVRAGKNIQVQASLSDGFMQASAGPVLTYSPYTFSAASTAYGGVVLLSGSGNVTLKNGMVVMPDGVYYDPLTAPLGNQPIAYYQDYFPLAGSGSTGNYVGTFNQWQNLAQALNRKYTVSPATVGGGAPSLAAYGDYASYAAAYQKWLGATYPTSASLSSTPPPPQVSADLSQYGAYLALWSQYSSRLTTLDGAPFFNKGAAAYIFPPLPPPISAGAVSIDPTLAGGNAPSNMPSLQNLAPLAYATLAGGDSSSYRLVAGAAPVSADPLALQASGGGSVVMSGYRAVTDEVVVNNNGVQQSRVLVFPTVVRTGNGFIDIAASQDFALSDQPQTTPAPGAVYTAGVPVPGTSAAPGVPGLFVNNGNQNSYSGPEILLGNAVNPTGAGDISIHAKGNIVGVENVVDASGAITGIKNNAIGQYWWPWMESTDSANASSINFSAFDQGILSVGGNVAVSAGGDIRDLAVSLPTTWNTGIDASGHPVGGGGNLNVNAGGSIYSGDYFVAKGGGSITAGGQIAPDLSLSTANTAIPGQVLTSPVSTLLGLQDTALQVNARQGVNLGGVYNPSYIADTAAIGVQSVADSQSYSASSVLKVTSTSGSVLFDTLTVPTALLSYGSTNFRAGALTLLPATLDLTALGGGISVQGPGGLFPSPTGQLALIAAQSISLYNNVFGVGGAFGLIDTPPSAMPSPLNPHGSDGASFTPDPTDNQNSYLNHPSTPLHASDPQPALIYSLNGSIVDGAISPSGYYYEEMVVAADKPAQVYAGQDIVNLSFIGQNLRDSDVTRIVAGHDLYDTAVILGPKSFGAPYNATSRIPALLLAGPGSFDVEAGRDIGPLISQTQALETGVGYNAILGNTKGGGGPQDNLTGIETVGNLFNPYLPRQGAGIDVLFGVGPSLDSQFNLKVGDFISRYIGLAANTAPGVPSIAGIPDYSAALVAFMDQYQQGLAVDTGYVKTGQPPVNLTPAQAWAAFQALPGYVRQQFVEQVFSDILFRTGQDYNSVGSPYYHQYARGYAAINALFPASYGYTQNSLLGGDNGSNNPKSTGDLDARNSTIQTQQGGDINLFGPGGQALLGSNLSPPNIYGGSGKLLNPPNTEGVLTLENGNVNIFTDQSVLLAQSRIFAERGGNLLIWSSNGDINAGEGLKTTAYIPPLQYLCNLDQYCVVDSKGEVSGAGIATLQTVPGAPPGNVELITPRGTVDAGDAGIRVSGNLTIAALHVANVFNIQVQGSSVGVPNTRVDTGALNAASSAAAAAQQASALATHVQPGAASMISVEVVGFGQPDEEQKRKMRRQREDGL